VFTCVTVSEPSRYHTQTPGLLSEPCTTAAAQVLKHRTQILYAADIAAVCSFLELRPGCLVLESGTGSGSLTHSLARAVAPSGGVRTFEFHEGRAAEADKEFRRHQLSKVVQVTHRDIEALGFPEELHGRADGVFLDLPGPWKVSPLAPSSLLSQRDSCCRAPGCTLLLGHSLQVPCTQRARDGRCCTTMLLSIPFEGV
jgi:tRNA (adenine57-N1/adenine58-N1)-methyltransferase catalytic subunit